MRQIVKDITNSFMSKLPAGQGYFTLTELARYDFPVFFLERMSLELSRNLIKSLELPDNKWIDPASDKIRQAWMKFKNTIATEVTLPASQAGSVFQHCVNDIVNTLVQPRTYVPEILFGRFDELTDSQIEDNARFLVVYEHFANALTRYMFKRNLDRITKEKGTLVIARVDEKLTQHYTSLNWVQLLEPWFALMGNEIDPSLLSQFFREKGEKFWVDRFDQVKSKITRDEIIKILSESETGSEEGKGRKSVEGNSKKEIEPDEERQAENHESPEEDKGPVSVWKPDPSLIYGDRIEDTEEDRKLDINKSEKTKSAPIWKQFAHSDNDDDSLIGQFTQKKRKKSESTLADSLANNVKVHVAKNKQSNIKEEDDLENAGEELKKLFKYVNDQSDYFVHELFGGNDDTFIQALEDISSFEKWDKASKYITNEIFRRNMVDIYSEPALDFTDALQNYFLEKSKSEK